MSISLVHVNLRSKVPSNELGAQKFLSPEVPQGFWMVSMPMGWFHRTLRDQRQLRRKEGEHTLQRPAKSSYISVFGSWLQGAHAHQISLAPPFPSAFGQAQNVSLLFCTREKAQDDQTTLGFEWSSNSGFRVSKQVWCISQNLQTSFAN